MSQRMTVLLQCLLFVLPWPLRRAALQAFFHFEIADGARIGLSILAIRKLKMASSSRIGNLTFCKGLSLMELGEAATIGSLNWITGFPEDDKTFFSSDVGRLPQLVIGAHSAITNRHYIDCTNSFRIGRFTTFAGVRSQVLTHSINLAECRQESHPVTLGDYCFVGTNCVLLSGSALPDYSVLGANSTLNKVYEQSHMLYAGTPARPVKHLDTNMAYFNRKVGFVH